MLPEGQDPDDLARSGGPQAIGEVLRRAQPLAEMLFLRETEGQRFDTPEKRAGLERRLRELTGQIADETLRRHYAADMDQRLTAFLGSAARPRRVGRPNAARAARGARAFADPGPRVGIAGAALPTPRHLARRPREAPREIAILAILIGHPSSAGAAFRGGRRARDRQRGARRLSRQIARARPRQAYGAPSAWAQALEFGGPGGRTRAHLEPGRRDAELVVPARRGRDLRRRARPSANHGLATKFRGAK